MGERNIVRIKFGSHLYGTQTPESDIDYKSVFVPDARSILLQRAKRSTNNHRPKGDGEKNYAGEVDEEGFSVQRYLQLVSEGQTVALDVLFAPEWAEVEPASIEWRQIVRNRDRFLTRKASAFVGYARTQANKYGIKGSRVSAGRKALEALEAGMAAYGTAAKLSSMEAEIRSITTAHPEHIGLVQDPTPHDPPLLMWEVCNRKMPFGASIKSARDVMARIVDEYGRRALMAESQQGVDWKALSHAVRVGRQAIELLTTCHITFPRPDAAELIAIKTGQLLYQDVASTIETLLEEVERASERSTLPDAPDTDWIDDFVEQVHRGEVARDAR